jgi:hypothetical protein
MMRTIWLFIIIILTIPSVFANLYYKAGSESQLIVPCYNEGMPCSDGVCNITIHSPTGITASNTEMDKVGIMYIHNFTPTILGVYTANVVCKDGTDYGTNNIQFEVNNLGFERENSAYIISFLLFFAVVAFILALIFFLYKKYLWATLMLPIISGSTAFLFFILYLYSIVLSNIYFTLYIIFAILFIALLLFAVYEVIYELMTGLNKKQRSTFNDTY